MKNRANKIAALLALVCMLATMFAVPVAGAASYSKVYGQTQDKIRVRESASTSATVIDNIIKGACVYVTDSKSSGSTTFVKVNYIGSDGKKLSGWVCQSDGKQTYVRILSKTQADKTFGVSGGDLPSKKVGTFTASQRSAGVASSSGSGSSSGNNYIKLGSNGDAVKTLQTKLKEMGFYSAEITGNVGEKTEAAIKAFQRKYGLTADGVAGPQTLAKIDAAYASRGNSSSSSSSSGLKEGSKGTAVSDLQRNLTTLGYYWAEITGNFGTKTETAVKRFQEENGLTVDGVAGEKTIAAIAKAVANKTGSSSTGSTSGSILTLNSQGTTVSQMQTDLKRLGYYYAEITGNFGAKTQTAVKKFQEENNLTVDGVAGPATLQAIAKAVAAAGGSSSSSSSSSSGTALKLGSTGDKVSTLQSNLTALGYYYAEITGHYGSKTEAAVKKFQKSRGLTQDGIAGSKTLEAIASAVKGSSSSSGVAVTGTLREGDSGDAVKDLQERLTQLGYYYGSITGNFGSLTRQAVRRFQDDNDLTVDGIAGSATLSLLASKTGGGTISSGTSTGGTTVATEDSYAVLAKNNVYLRKSYSTSSAAIASLSQGTQVRLTRRYTVSGETWYYATVSVGGYTYKGYIRSDMLTKVSAPSDTEEDWGIDTGDKEILGMIRITANKVNLRAEANTGSSVVGTANMGDVFYYVDTVEGWFQTRGGSWVSRDYAKVLSSDEEEDYNSSSSGDTYREGDTGSMVKWIQETLADLGYYTGEITGSYGSLTKEAVRLFQRANGISADGVAGPKTIAKINEVASGDAGSTVDQGVGSLIYNIDYFDNLYVFRTTMPRGTKITLTDFTTNKSFSVRVQSVGNHLDVEPVTSADTAVLCSLYGVSSSNMLVTQNKYRRRAMIVTTHTNSGTLQFIGSIYAIPHGTDTISGNDFAGQFCLHFKNSKTHGTNRVDDDANGHQDIISRCASSLTSNGKTVLTTPPFAQ